MLKNFHIEEHLYTLPGKVTIKNEIILYIFDRKADLRRKALLEI